MADFATFGVTWGELSPDVVQFVSLVAYELLQLSVYLAAYIILRSYLARIFVYPNAPESALARARTIVSFFRALYGADDDELLRTGGIECARRARSTMRQPPLRAASSVPRASRALTASPLRRPRVSLSRTAACSTATARVCSCA
jgi:hypothetical protein